MTPTRLRRAKGGLAGSIRAMVIGGGLLLIGLIVLVVYVVRAMLSKGD